MIDARMRVGNEARSLVLGQVLRKQHYPCGHIVDPVRHVDGVAGRERRLHLLDEERVQVREQTDFGHPITRRWGGPFLSGTGLGQQLLSPVQETMDNERFRMAVQFGDVIGVAVLGLALAYGSRKAPNRTNNVRAPEYKEKNQQPPPRI
jgi:hypothetical protein